jgi:hypothetical protein
MIGAILGASGAALWLVAALAGAITLFLGATLSVALFHPDPKHRADAFKILKTLLDFFRRGGDRRGPRGRR